MKLDQLKIGQSAYINSIECDSSALMQHMLDMGLTPNTLVTLIKTAPMGDPLEIRLRGYELTLRKSDASCISVTSTSAMPMKISCKKALV